MIKKKNLGDEEWREGVVTSGIRLKYKTIHQNHQFSSCAAILANLIQSC